MAFSARTPTTRRLTKIVETTKRHKREHRLLWDFLKLFHHCSYLSLGPERGKDETEAVPEVKWLFETQSRDGCLIVSTSDPIPEKGTEADKDVQPPHRQAANHHRRVVKDKDGQFKVTMEIPSVQRPEAAGHRDHRGRGEPAAGGAGRHRHRNLAAGARRMTMPHEWLQTWGEAIEPDQLSGSFAVRFRNFLTNEAAGLASIIGARRHEAIELLILEVETNRPQRPAYPILHREPVAVVLSDGAVRAGRAGAAARLSRHASPKLGARRRALLALHRRPALAGGAAPLHAGRVAASDHEVVRARGPWRPSRPADNPWTRFSCARDPRCDAAKCLRVRLRRKSRAHRQPARRGQSRHHYAPTAATGRGTGVAQGAFLFVALQIAPQAMSRMRRAPCDLASLIRELVARGVDLADELTARITAWSAEGGDSRRRFGSRLGILLQMPIIGPDGVTTGATDSVAFLTLATVGDIGIALGRLGRSPANMKGGPRYTRLLAPAEWIRTRWLQCRCSWASPMSSSTASAPPSCQARPPIHRRRIVQIGAGTIGSLTAEILVREGFGVALDHYRSRLFAAAQPRAPRSFRLDVGLPKALGLAHRLRALRTDLCRGRDRRGCAQPRRAPRRDCRCISVGGLGDRRGGFGAGRAFFVRSGRRGPAGKHLLQPGRHFGCPADGKPRSERRSAHARGGLLWRHPAGAGAARSSVQSADAIPYAGACRAVTSRIPASRAQTLTGLGHGGLGRGRVQGRGALRGFGPSLPTASTSRSHHRCRLGAVGLDRGWTITLPRVSKNAFCK